MRVEPVAEACYVTLARVLRGERLHWGVSHTQELGCVELWTDNSERPKLALEHAQLRKKPSHRVVPRHCVKSQLDQRHDCIKCIPVFWLNLEAGVDDERMALVRLQESANV